MHSTIYAIAHPGQRHHGDRGYSHLLIARRRPRRAQPSIRSTPLVEAA